MGFPTLRNCLSTFVKLINVNSLVRYLQKRDSSDLFCQQISLGDEYKSTLWYYLSPNLSIILPTWAFNKIRLKAPSHQVLSVRQYLGRKLQNMQVRKADKLRVPHRFLTWSNWVLPLKLLEKENIMQPTATCLGLKTKSVKLFRVFLMKHFKRCWNPLEINFSL